MPFTTGSLPCCICLMGAPTWCRGHQQHGALNLCCIFQRLAGIAWHGAGHRQAFRQRSSVGAKILQHSACRPVSRLARQGAISATRFRAHCTWATPTNSHAQLT